MTPANKNPVILCPHCGRRSFQMLNTCRRTECGLQHHDVAEKIGFLSLCNHQKERMSNLEIYGRRRRNTLKMAAKALNRKRKAADENDIQRYKDRVIKVANHIVLLDEIWMFLNQTRQFFYGYIMHNELVIAATHVREGSFDDYYKLYFIDIYVQ